MAPLIPPRRFTALRTRLGAAACLLVAAGARTSPANAQDTTAVAPPPEGLQRWQLDGAALLYGEKGRAKIIEPQARITRLFADGQTFSATFGLDIITGASPTGAAPSTTVQTTTTPSGGVATHGANSVPVNPFSDTRGGLDLEWIKPIHGWLTPSLGAHASLEKDYRSFGASAKVSVAAMHRLTTFTLGAGYNEDRVDPVGGTRAPLSDGTVLLGSGANPKRVRSGMAGISRVLTRRWLFGVNASRSVERGYLTDPYKVISVLDSTGSPLGQLTESRPSSRTRSDVLASTVYHLSRDIVYANYRYYWDDWGVTSHTADARYRLELGDQRFFQPRVRYYFQTRANFFQEGLPDRTPLPAFASSDVRLGDLRTLTLGATYGFHPAGGPGELSLRAEYIRQWGGGATVRAPEDESEFEPEDGAESGSLDYSPPVDIGSIVIGYSIPF